ncbi:MAG: type II secretion system protein [Candidatus Riflebacteria bacterium]|nr:type II secretion system protein [Candidatus Riflebacteria bacterium]
MKHKKIGITLIEILIAVAVLGLMMTFLLPIFSYSRRAGTTMNRLDVYHDIRKVDHAISGELKLGSGVLYPPKPAGDSTTDWYSQVIFRNHLNQVLMVYLNEQDKLVLFNYDDIKDSYLSLGRFLGSKVKDFAVRRHGNSVIEYKLTFEIEKQDFTISNRITLVNVF